MRAIIRDTPIIAMMVVQLTVWMSLFYSFPALVLFWQADFGWTTAQIMGAFSLSIAVYALGAPLYGRLIDRGLAPITFPLGTLGGAVLLVSLTSAETLPRFYTTWAALGICMGLTLYEPCFALVTRARAGDARRAITAITLVGGFASTLAYPLATTLAANGGWRAAIHVLAALVVLVAAPLSLWAARHRWRAAS